MATSPRGKFVTFEGIDGSGKSTQARFFSSLLNDLQIEHHLTREPGGSDGAEDIRRLLVEGDPGRWSPETEILLFTAARRDHLERTIEPRLAAGNWVVSDRFADSTRVYQGAARADLRGTVDRLHDLMIGREEHDLHKRRKGRNLALLAVLLGFVAHESETVDTAHRQCLVQFRSPQLRAIDA